MESYEYGGQVWYKDYTMDDWESGGSLIKTEGGLNECIFTGSQLGSPDWSMKMKGCAYAHAKLGSGTDKRISMTYVYNPGSFPFDISLSLGDVGLSFDIPGNIYSTESTQYLSW